MKEKTIIIVTMILNFIIAIIKLVSGIVFSFSTLIADSIQSFVDFFTDIISLIASKIGKRRANKKYPFGYGQIYSVANLLTGVLLFLIGLFILYQVFFMKAEVVIKPLLFLILFLIIVLKSIVVYLLRSFGKTHKSEIMIEASKESNADLVSTVVVLIVSLLVIVGDRLAIFIDFDKIGSLLMCFVVFNTSIKLVYFNVISLLTHTEENKEITDAITQIVNKHKNVEYDSIRLIKMVAYYSVQVTIRVSPSITMKEYFKLEKKIKKEIKEEIPIIKYVEFEPTIED
jgi:cation diffusion facilitator family transporter